MIADKLIGVPTIESVNNTWSWNYSRDTGEVTVDEIFDFDGDHDLTAADLDLLCGEVRGAGNSHAFDLTDDTLVNSDDVNAFLQQAGSLPGDANLSGDVEFSDFLALSAKFGQTGSWSHGDFDCSGQVGFADFLVLSSNFSQASESNTAAAVPEPSTGVLLLLTAGWFCWIRPTRLHRR